MNSMTNWFNKFYKWQNGSDSKTIPCINCTLAQQQEYLKRLNFSLERVPPRYNVSQKLFAYPLGRQRYLQRAENQVLSDSPKAKVIKRVLQDMPPPPPPPSPPPPSE
jgi:hypothetical protein